MGSFRYAVVGSWGHLATPLAEAALCEQAVPVGLAPGVDGEDMQQLRQRTRSLADVPIFGDHHTLIAETKPDLVIVSTPLWRIAEIAMDAADAGCHLICEKPLAIDLPALDRLEQKVRQKRVHCLAMLHNRANPILAAAMHVIESGKIGKVVLVNTRKSYKWGTRPDWFADRARYGGTIPWIGIHALDFIDAVSGSTWTQVAALHSNRAHPTHSDCEDNCVMILRLASGGHCTASIDLLRPAASASHGDDWIRVVGTEGTMEAYLERGYCHYTSEKGAEIHVAPRATNGSYSRLFAALSSGDASPLEETARAFHLTRTALIARDAADQQVLLPVPGERA